MPNAWLHELCIVEMHQDRQTLRYVGLEDPGVLIAFSSGVGRIWPGDGDRAFCIFFFFFVVPGVWSSRASSLRLAWSISVLLSKPWPKRAKRQTKRRVFRAAGISAGCVKNGSPSVWRIWMWILEG